MIIKKRPVITWLLSPCDSTVISDIRIAQVNNPINHGLLLSDFERLEKIRDAAPIWELPELIMPSFEEVMRKSEKSFEKIMPELFVEFGKTQECGILLCRGNVTLVYGFGENELHIWHFTENQGKSIFNFHTVNKSIFGQIGVGITNTLVADNCLFQGSLEQRQIALASVANFVASYVAVKKYVKVETVIIPQGKFSDLVGTPLEYVEKKKVINYSGQEVIVMDSKWFRKIINNNDIYVRGFWRMQNKKNSEGQWYKELIFVDSFIRHGYHRNAKIEEDKTRDKLDDLATNNKDTDIDMEVDLTPHENTGTLGDYFYYEYGDD